jgi:outer membrane protein OmpA-like peptidoglycan-associated protein
MPRLLRLFRAGLSRSFDGSGKLPALLRPPKEFDLDSPTRKPSGKASRGVAIAVVALLSAYLLIGYVAVPIAVESQIISTVSERTGLTPTLESVRFDPFRFRLGVDGFELREPGAQSPLVGFERLIVDLRPTGFFGADVALSEIRLVRPLISVVIDEDGVFGPKRLLGGDAQDDAGPASDEASELESDHEADPVLVDIDSIHVEGGRLVFRDLEREETFEVLLSSLEIALDGFTTRAGETFEYELGLAVGDETTVESSGTVGFDPLHSSGRIDLEDVDLRVPWTYLAERLRFEVVQGELGLSARYEMASEEEFELAVSDTTIALNDLVLIAVDSGTPEGPRELISLPSVSVSGIEGGIRGVTLARLAITDVEIGGGRLSVELDQEGGLTLADLFSLTDSAAGSASASTEKKLDAEKEPSESDLPTELRIGRFAVRDLDLSFEDHSQPNPVALEASALTLTVTGYGNTGDDRAVANSMNVDLGMGLGEAGHFAVKGPLRIEPLDGKFAVSAEKISLREFTPYVQRWLQLDIRSATLSSELEVEFSADDAKPVNWLGRGRVEVDDLQASQIGRDDDLLTWKAVRLEGLNVQIDRTEVDEVALDGVFARVEIGPGGVTNFHSVSGAEHTQSSVTSENGSASPPEHAIIVHKIGLAEGSAVVLDTTIDPPPTVRFDRLSGTIDGLSSESIEPARVSLEGRLDGAAPLSIRGRINLFDAASSNEMLISAKGVSMPKFGPYSGRYVGYGIARGTLDLELDYQVDARELKAQNHFRLDRFKFAEKVESPGATSLPVRLAFTMMRDSEGRIEIDLPVEGNLDDPSFSLFSVIEDQFVRLVTNVVTAPIGIVGGIVGFSAKDLSTVIFAAGAKDLSESERVQIDRLRQVLVDRPDLQAEIRGRADPVIDRLSRDAEESGAEALELARARAVSVRNLLLENGEIEAKRVSLVEVEVGDFGSEDGVPTELEFDTSE